MKRREFLKKSLSAALASAAAGSRAVGASKPPRGVLADDPDLLEIAKGHVQLAEATRSRAQLWGRLGGSDAERASARLFAKQLNPYVVGAELESFAFSAYRPARWSLSVQGAGDLASAMPTPFDARFTDGVVRAPVHPISNELDWKGARGRFAFVEATMQASVYRNSVREGNLYKRAVEAGAVGLVFSLPMKPGRWRAVAPIDKAYAVRDEAYPDKRRPISCFVIDAADGALLAAARNTTIEARVEYEPRTQREALNVVGVLPGLQRSRVVIFNHLDSFFSGANDNASGIATTVGLARRIAMLSVEKRLADFLFVGLAAHHDGGEGMRAFRARDPRRYASLTHAILIEHTDALGGKEAQAAGWPESFNDQRQAYLGSKGWPEVKSALADLVARSQVMTTAPQTVDACIGDLLVICGEMPSFCLIQGPPYYHTDHDTIDKISRAGIEAAVDFHMRLLEVIKALAPGSSER
ncbi:MAG: M28 family peptidase [Acidobacteriota bacterium]